MDNRAIGVFDSGLGGLTVVKELKRAMPDESIVYLGDTGRVPYGTRSRETILKYSREDVDFLRRNNVKIVIAACGTASTVLKKEMYDGEGFIYTGVVQPAASAAAMATKNRKIGVIGTPAAIKSGAYEQEIQKHLPDAAVFTQACPLFVALVENGYIGSDNTVTLQVAEDYLSPLRENGVDTLIMGCTHFPLIKDIIAKVMGDSVTLIDAGQETARHVMEILNENNMLSYGASRSERFFVTDEPQNFREIAKTFLGGEIDDCVEKILL